MADYLRRWRRDDAHALAAVYAQADADLLNNIPENRSPAGALAWIEGIRAAENEGSRAWQQPGCAASSIIFMTRPRSTGSNWATE